MNKMWNIMIITLALFFFSSLLIGCETADGESEEAYKVSFVSKDNGYFVEVVRGESKWSNLENGVFGVQLSYDDLDNVSEIEYVYYDKYTQVDGGYIATAEITTEDGSVFVTEDSYRISKTGVEVVRDFKVKKVGTGLGFMTYFPIRDTQTGEVMDREWFAPSAYYGNDEYNFWGTGIKIGFSENAIANVDNLSAPIVANYINGTAMSITDRTQGYRETIVADAEVITSSIMVDEVFNIPGIGLKDVYNDDSIQVEMYHCYPSPTHNYINIYPFNWNYRMLPISEGLERETAFEIRIDDYNTLDSAIETLWRDVYNEYSVKEYRYVPVDVYKALTDNIYRSYGILNSVPQYMTNSDHPFPESGFLYRNTDLASLMIAAGYRLNKPEYIEQANGVIDFHIAKDLIVDNISNKFERSETEGVMAVLEAYRTHLEHGVNKGSWLAYVLQKTEQKREVGDPMNIPLFLKVAEYIKDDSLIELSAEILKEFEETHADYFYTGSIVNPAGDPIPNREASMIYMNIYLAMYELTGEKHYLDKAKHAEVYFESNMIIQNIAMEAMGTIGYETLSGGRFRELGMVGNSQIKPYGLSWVSGQTASADNASAYAVPDIVKLYEITGDQKYKDFADYLMTNSILYVNMGDKNWLMDDIRFSSGYGFQNEYFGIAASSDRVSAGRGTMHTSNLGWNMFVVLNSLEYLAKHNENYFVEKIPAYDTSVLKYALATSEENSMYRAYNAVDKRSETSWKPAATDNERALTILLGDYVQVEKIEVCATGSYVVEVSNDGVNYTEVDKNNVNDMCRYVRLEVAEGVAVSNVSVIGNPVVKKNYALDSKVTVMGVKVDTMTDWNYGTLWRSTKQSDTIFVDLGKIRGITEISMLFNINLNFSGQDFISSVNNIQYQYKIEFSANGEDWFTYVDKSDNTEVKAVYTENSYVRTRYFKITAYASSGTLTMNELKIYGK